MLVRLELEAQGHYNNDDTIKRHFTHFNLDPLTSGLSTHQINLAFIWALPASYLFVQCLVFTFYFFLKSQLITFIKMHCFPLTLVAKARQAL